jgi:arsenate reductase
MAKKRVLFLCTGNSARSQMAEGLVRQDVGDRWEAFSAGTKPAGYVHPLAVRAMSEIGIDISHQRSKSVDEVRNQTFDLVVTVCDQAAKSCPAWLGGGRALTMGFPDPAAATGDESHRLDAFRAVRDDLYRNVVGLLKQLNDNLTNGEGHDNVYDRSRLTEIRGPRPISGEYGRDGLD